MLQDYSGNGTLVNERICLGSSQVGARGLGQLGVWSWSQFRDLALRPSCGFFVGWEAGSWLLLQASCRRVATGLLPWDRFRAKSENLEKVQGL